MKTRRLLLAAASTAVATGMLVGCSATGTPDAKNHATSDPKATSKAERTPNPTSTITPPALEQASAECTDGTATLKDLNNKEVTVGDCAKVVIDTSNAIIHLGAVEDLTVKGAINGIDVESLERVTIDGDGNRITTASKPKVEDHGTSNTIGR